MTQATTRCGRCGTVNPADAEFCVSCRAFLEFEAKPVDTTPETPLPGSGSGSGSGSVTPVFGPPVSAPPVSAPPVSAPPGSGSPVNGTPVSTSPVSAPPTVPQARQPDAPIVTRTTQGAYLAPDGPADIRCPRCQTGNDISRRFCRRCGESLQSVTVVALPWWRRVLNRLRRKPLEAGQRPPRRRRTNLLWPTLAVFVAIVILIAAAPPLRDPLVSDVRHLVASAQDRFIDPTPLVPVSATASSSASGLDPKAVFDGATDSYWAPGKPAPATGEWVELKFDRAARVVELLVTSGISADHQKFLTQSRPAELTVLATDPGGRTTTRKVKVADQASAQHVKIGIDKVATLRLTITSAYDPQPGRLVAIAELEAFVRG